MQEKRHGGDNLSHNLCTKFAMNSGLLETPLNFTPEHGLLINEGNQLVVFVLRLTILTGFAISPLAAVWSEPRRLPQRIRGRVAFVFGPWVPEAEEVALKGRGPAGEGRDCCRSQTCYLAHLVL